MSVESFKRRGSQPGVAYTEMKGDGLTAIHDKGEINKLDEGAVGKVRPGVILQTQLLGEGLVTIEIPSAAKKKRYC